MENKMKNVKVDNCSNCDKFGTMTEWNNIQLCVHCAKASVNWK